MLKIRFVFLLAAATTTTSSSSSSVALDAMNPKAVVQCLSQYRFAHNHLSTTTRTNINNCVQHLMTFEANKLNESLSIDDVKSILESLPSNPSFQRRNGYEDVAKTITHVVTPFIPSLTVSDRIGLLHLLSQYPKEIIQCSGELDKIVSELFSSFSGSCSSSSSKQHSLSWDSLQKLCTAAVSVQTHGKSQKGSCSASDVIVSVLSASLQSPPPTYNQATVPTLSQLGPILYTLVATAPSHSNNPQPSKSSSCSWLAHLEHITSDVVARTFSEEENTMKDKLLPRQFFHDVDLLVHSLVALHHNQTVGSADEIVYKIFRHNGFRRQLILFSGTHPSVVLSLVDSLSVLVNSNGNKSSRQTKRMQTIFSKLLQHATSKPSSLSLSAVYLSMRVIYRSNNNNDNNNNNITTDNKILLRLVRRLVALFATQSLSTSCAREIKLFFDLVKQHVAKIHNQIEGTAVMLAAELAAEGAPPPISILTFVPVVLNFIEERLDIVVAAVVSPSSFEDTKTTHPRDEYKSILTQVLRDHHLYISLSTSSSLLWTIDPVSIARVGKIIDQL
eukprot:PhM_4_TR5150/c0_g1_i1/m.23046